MEIFRCRMADARMDQLAEQITETRGLIEELRDQLMPIAEVRFKQAALERQHRLRIQDELQQLRQQFPRVPVATRSSTSSSGQNLSLRVAMEHLQEEVGDLARTIFHEPAVSRVRPSSSTAFRRA